MTPEQRQEQEIIFGLNIQAPAPKNFKEEKGYYISRRTVNCPECNLQVREVGYRCHWAKVHRQTHQIEYFKKWKVS